MRKLAASRPPEARGVIVTDAGRGSAGRLRRRARWCGIRETGKYRRTRLFVLTLGYSRKSIRLLGLRARARASGPSCTSRRFADSAARAAGRRARQSARGRAHARHLRPDAQSALPRRASRTTASSRCRAACAIPIARARSSRRSATRRNAAARACASRASTRRRRTSIAGRRQLGRHAHPRHDQAPGRRDVRRGAAVAAAAAGRAVSLLPVRQAHRASRRPRRGRRRLLLRAARARSAATSAVQWDERTCASSTRRRGSSCASTCGSSRDATAPTTKIGRRARRAARGQLLSRAERAGTHIGTLCAEIHRRDGEHGVRRILGVLSLARKHGAHRRRRRLRRGARARRRRPTASCAATSSATRPCRSRCARSIR